MKLQKSSSTSLYNSSSNILRQKPSNYARETTFKTTTSSIYGKEFNIYNARGRLNIAFESLGVLKQNTKMAGQTNKNLKLQMDCLKEEYLEGKLNALSGQISTMVKELKKKVSIRQRSDLLKYQSIQNIFDSLSKSHKQLKNKVQEIELRVVLVENIMGNDLIRNACSL